MRITKITTKVGDKGKTSLGDGIMVSKNNIRIKTVGLLDEVNARVGHAIIESSNKDILISLKDIQNNLFNIGGELALGEKAEPIFNEEKVFQLESKIENLNSHLEPLTEFILPGGDEFISRLHLARTATRQAEISLFTLKENEMVRDSLCVYMNRLSDYFFVLARFYSAENKIHENVWEHNK